MESWFMFLVIFLSVVAMIFAISKMKQHPFIVMVVIAIIVGLVCGMEPEEVIKTVKTGFGNILGNIGIVILCGTIIGTILEKTGAALTMANTILGIVGKERSVLTMGIVGYITGIPVFCDSGFVILSPISRALAAQSNKSLAVIATALSGGLYATHCLVPPTPGPIAIAGNLGADLGLVIMVGLAISVPAVAFAIFYANHVASKIDIPANPQFTVEELLEKYGKLPGALHSFSPILLPIVLIALKSIGDFKTHPFGEGAFQHFISFIGNPVIALILGVFLAMTLIPVHDKDIDLAWVTEGVQNSASILVITAAGGSFGAILGKLPIADALQGSLLNLGLGILIPFLISTILKLSMGASTVAMIVTSQMIAPLLGTLGFDSTMGKVLVTMAIGAGSMTASHANDSYFWVVSQFSDMKPEDAYKCQTGMTGCMGLVCLAVIYLLSLVLL